MSSLINKENIQAELSLVNDRLSVIPELDFLRRASFEQRKKELEEELSVLNEEWRTAAEAIIYFGGEPVRGSESIQATFAARALSRFQEYITAFYSSLKHKLQDRGAIPFANESVLQLTGVARGSFGFILKEDQQQMSMIDSKLSEALDGAIKLLASSMEESDEKFDEEIESVNARVLSSLKLFIDTMHDGQASFELKTKNMDVVVTHAKIIDAQKHVENIEIITSEESVTGIFKGATQMSRGFDFEPSNFRVDRISGKISKDIEDDFISAMNLEYMDKKCIAKVELTEIKKKNATTSRFKWILLDISPER